MYCSKYLQVGSRKGNIGPLQKCSAAWRHRDGPELAVGKVPKLNLASTFCNDPSCLLFSVITGSSSKSTCKVGLGKHEFLVKSTAFNTGKWFL